MERKPVYVTLHTNRTSNPLWLDADGRYISTLYVWMHHDGLISDQLGMRRGLRQTPFWVGGGGWRVGMTSWQSGQSLLGLAPEVVILSMAWRSFGGMKLLMEKASQRGVARLSVARPESGSGKTPLSMLTFDKKGYVTQNICLSWPKDGKKFLLKWLDWLLQNGLQQC